MKLIKELINAKRVPHLSKNKRDPKCGVGLWRIIHAILKRLKTGCQWRESPIKELFDRRIISYKAVFYYVCTSCLLGRNFALGFLQTQPQGYALALS